MTRNKLEKKFMHFAKSISEMSTCLRAQVGSIIVNEEYTQILAFGYNGNASGLPNTCDSVNEGACGCVHAEINSLLKCDYSIKDKVMFTTTSPCVPCAKAIINSRVIKVFYNVEYRTRDGIELLKSVGIPVIQLEVK